jgi:hypothetical protein
MSKRGGDSTHLHISKVKKRRGVGSRSIIVPDSDEEGPPLVANSEYARVMKTRVAVDGTAEKISMKNVPIFERPSTPVLPEDVIDDSADAIVENVVPVVPAKRHKKVNDSVSDPTISTSLYC